MKYFNQALQKDINQEYVNAIELYEESIKREETIDAFINLAFLYWQVSSEFAFRDQYGISDKWLSIGSDRYNLLLNQSIILFSKNAEPIFWKKYFDHISLGEELTENDVLNILKKCEDGLLVPCFFLYLLNPRKYNHQIDEIIAKAKEKPTSKYLYILSVLQVPLT